MFVVSDLDSVTRIGRYEPPKFALAQSQWLRPHNSMGTKKSCRAKSLCLSTHVDKHVLKFSYFLEQMPWEQHIPEVTGTIYRNSTVLSSYRLDHRWIYESCERPCRHSFLPDCSRFNNSRSYVTSTSSRDVFTHAWIENTHNADFWTWRSTCDSSFSINITGLLISTSVFVVAETSIRPPQKLVVFII